MEILIVGGGICGLGTALLLARDGHDVTVLERDPNWMPASAQDAWDGWKRKGVAQFRQPHNFMPGLRQILERELPDVQEQLRLAGASKFDLINPLPPPIADRSPRAIDDKLWTYTARRPTGEWVFANAAQNEPRVTIKRGVKALELLEGPSVRTGVPHVAGVRTLTGEEERADIVIDATGRASRSPKWLREIGARTPEEKVTEFGFTYYSRYFRGREPERRAPPLTHLGTISILTLPGDNGTWSVTIFTAAGDKELRRLRQPDHWTAVIRACPLHAHWLAGEPLGDVQVMSGSADRYRRFVVDGVPVATGFAAVADAWACTNPNAGRGLAVGFIHAVRLRDTLRNDRDDPYALAMQFDAVTEADVTPWYDAQVATDRLRFAEMEALLEGRNPPPPDDELSWQCAALRATMPSDPDLFRAGLEYIGTITPIQELFRRPEVAERVAAASAGMGKTGQGGMPGPKRAQLLELGG